MTVRRTPRALLLSVGLPSNTRSYRRLDAALDRLTKPIGEYPPMLASWERLDDGRLKLRVHGCWLGLRHKRGYARLPLPLPLHSPTVLSLYVFLNSIWTDNRNTRTSDVGDLYRRVGMMRSLRHGKRRGSQELEATLKRALDTINHYLGKLDEKLLRRHGLHETVPFGYAVEVDPQSGRVRLVALPRNRDEREEIEYEIALRQEGRMPPKSDDEEVTNEDDDFEELDDFEEADDEVENEHELEGYLEAIKSKWTGE